MDYDFRGARKAVWESDLPGHLKLLALALIEHMPNCRPSVLTLAARCSVKRKAVLKAITRLERLAILTVARSPGMRSSYNFQPVPLWRTGPSQGTRPPRGTSGVGDTSPLQAPNQSPLGATTSPLQAPNQSPPGDPKQEEADLKAGRKRPANTLTSRCPQDDPEPESAPIPVAIASDATTGRLGPSKRERAREAQAAALNGLQPLRHRFNPDWQPNEDHRIRGLEMGLTEEQILERAEDCRLKPIKQGFHDEDEHFMRELNWLRGDLEKARFRDQQLAARRDFETPGHRRSAQ